MSQAIFSTLFRKSSLTRDQCIVMRVRSHINAHTSTQAHTYNILKVQSCESKYYHPVSLNFHTNTVTDARTHIYGPHSSCPFTLFSIPGSQMYRGHIILLYKERAVAAGNVSRKLFASGKVSQKTVKNLSIKIP